MFACFDGRAGRCRQQTRSRREARTGISSRLLLLSMLLGGCGTQIDSSYLGDGGFSDATTTAAALTLLSEPIVQLRFREQSTIRVRYAEADGSPIPAATLRLSLIADPDAAPHDSSLEQLEVQTDADGIGSTKVSAGLLPAIFRIRISAERAPAIYAEVGVSGEGFGTLRVRYRYEGEREIEAFHLGLFADLDCPSVATLGAGSWPRELGLSESQTLFTGLPAGIGYAIRADAIGPSGAIMAQACVGGILVEAGLESFAELILTDLPTRLTGTFDATLGLDAASVGATLAEGVGAEALALVAEGGGDLPLIFQAFDAELRSRAELGAADTLALERATGAEEALSALLLRRAAGNGAAAEALRMHLQGGLSSFALVGTLGADPSAPEPFAFELDGALLQLSDAGELPVRVPLGEPIAAGLLSLTVDAPAGKLTLALGELPLGVGQLASLLLDALGASLGEADAEGWIYVVSGLSSLSTFVAERPYLAMACDAACVRAVGIRALAPTLLALQVALVEADLRFSSLALAGTGLLIDADRDLLFEEVWLERLEGSWSGAANPTGEAITAELRASLPPLGP